MLLVCPICAWSHLLHPVPELAQRLQPLTSRGQLQQGVAAHNQVILDSRNVLRRVYFKMYSYWVTLYCHRHLQSEWHGGRNPPARLGSIINDHPRNKTFTLCVLSISLVVTFTWPSHWYVLSCQWRNPLRSDQIFLYPPTNWNTLRTQNQTESWA